MYVGNEHHLGISLATCPHTYFLLGVGEEEGGEAWQAGGARRHQHERSEEGGGKREEGGGRKQYLGDNALTAEGGVAM